MIQEANLAWAYIDTETKLVMPWYTLPTLQWLKTQDTSQWIVFEYGAGYSTIWWTMNALKVISIDSNEVWSKAMQTWLATTEEKYVHSIQFWATPIGTTIDPEVQFPINDNNLFDCVIVDGEWREECVKYCLQFIRSGGFLIIDNWDQEDYPHDAVERTLDLLKDWERQIYAQPNHRTWKTAVFTKP